MKTRNKAKKGQAKKGNDSTPETEEHTTENEESRSETPEGEPNSTPPAQAENDNEGGSTQREVSMPLPDDQQSAENIDLSTERGGYLSKNTHDTYSDTPGLPQEITQMEPLAGEQTQQEMTQTELQTRQERRVEKQELQQAELIKLLVEGLALAQREAGAERQELQAQIQLLTQAQHQYEARVQAQFAQTQREAQAQQQVELRLQAQLAQARQEAQLEAQLARAQHQAQQMELFKKMEAMILTSKQNPEPPKQPQQPENPEPHEPPETDLGTSWLAPKGNQRKTLTFTGTPPRNHEFGLQDEHEAEATGPVNETSDKTLETDTRFWEPSETDIKKLEQEWEEFKLFKGEKERPLKGQSFAVRKDGRDSDRRSEDQTPNNQKLIFLKAKLEEDKTSTGKAQGKTRKKEVCNPENDQESELHRQGGILPQTPESPEKMFYELLKNTMKNAAWYAKQERDSQQQRGGGPQYWQMEC